MTISLVHSRQTTWVLVAAAAVLALGGVLAAGQLANARAAALRDGEDLAACRQLAGQIGLLRDRPTAVSEQALGELELARRIEEAGTLAGISRSSFHRIDPQTPRRIDRSVYREMPTRVSLRQVTLRQVVNLLYNLAADGSGLIAREIRFSAPREETSDELWHVELTLAYLVYDPPTTTATSSLPAQGP